MQAVLQSLQVGERSQLRARRQTVSRESTLRDPDDAPIDVRITDLSATGFLVEAPLDLAIDSIVRVGLAGAGTAQARVVRRDDSGYGCQFLRPLSNYQIEAAFQCSNVLNHVGEVEQPHQAAGYVDSANKWPRPVRAAVIIGSASALWIGVLSFLLL